MKISDWLLPKNAQGEPKVEISNTGDIAVEVNTDAMEATLIAIKGTGSGSIDDCASRLQTVSERVEFVNSRLNNIQNSITQDGLGGGNKLGVINDSIASACNTIKDNTEFVNSRLNNIQTAQTNKSQLSQIVARTDIADDSTKTNLKCSVAGSLNVKMDDHASVVVQGVSDQSNPFGTKKPLLIDTAGKLLVVDSSSTITRGNITFPSPFGSGDDSTSIDVGNNKTFHFHTEGSAGLGHGGFLLQGSNNNSNFVNVQLFTVQTISGTDSIRGSISEGYQYYRFKNKGTSVSVTTNIYNSYS